MHEQDDTEITENDTDFEIEKDIIGNCRLIVKSVQKHHAAKYSCKIKGREKEKNCHTKTELVIKGRLDAACKQDSNNSSMIQLHTKRGYYFSVVFIFRYFHLLHFIFLPVGFFMITIDAHSVYIN